MNKLLTLVAVAFGTSLALPAAALTVDGNLADWGINPATWAPAPGSGIQATIEDGTGSGAFYLNPGWGGQAYDAEALYANLSLTDQKLYIALVTGHDPRTLNQPSANSYGAGDFAIDFGKDGSYEVGINIKHVTSFVNSTDYTVERFGVEGGIYRDAQWNYGLWNSSGGYTDPTAPGYSPDPLHPTNLAGGTLAGMATLAYTTTPTTGYGSAPLDGHYFYEMSLDLQVLRNSGWQDGQAFDIHWTENCANDSILVDPPGDLPEPGTLLLTGLGLLGLVHPRTKKKAVAR